jgi:RNA polymerase sigma-70 factor, ECF subfamily
LLDDEVAEFDALYGAHVDAMFAYALARTSPDRAKEIVEETFLVAWRRLADVPSDPRPWLFGVARRVLANERRGDDRREALELHIRASRAFEFLGEDPADVVANRDAALIALDRLRESDRELLRLIAWEGLTLDQAAGLLGCSKPTLKVRLHRARRRFDSVLDGLADHRVVDQPAPGRPRPTAIARFPTPRSLLSKETI